MLIQFSDDLKRQLKRPLGRFTTVEKAAATGRKLIAIGDETTINVLKAGLKPHLAVCDSRVKRKKLEKKKQLFIRKSLKLVGRYKNPPGTLSTAILSSAKKHLKRGGLILIDGEEDLTALAYVLYGSSSHLILYGQPDEGLVAVKPEKEIKKKIRKLLAAASLGHEV
ncbi:MAG: DUF359 domain-containing protein [Candidatus Micrarchaeota archaeon]